MTPLATLFRAAAVAAALTLAPGCAYQFKKQEEAAEKMPVNCATAEGDLRVLKGEKAHVGEQIAMGVTAIVPASLVIGILTGTEVEKLKVASGEYNKQIDAKIAEIQAQCGVQ
jgi:hypothetical protein